MENAAENGNSAMSAADRYASSRPKRSSVSRTSSTIATPNSTLAVTTAISPSQPGAGQASTRTSIGNSGRNA